MKEIKEFLESILTYIQIPDYHPEDIIDDLMNINSFRLIICKQGPRVSWEVVAKTRENYQNILEFLLLPTWFFQLFRKLHVQLKYNDPYYNPFFTPIFHVTKVETEGYLFFDSAEDYYRYLDLL